MAISKVRAKINGTWYTLTHNSSTKEYELDYTATAVSSGQTGGYYNVEVEATASDGATATDSGTTNTGLRLVVQDTTNPTLTVTSPSNNLVTAASSITVSGTAKDDSGIQSVTVNGKTVTVGSNGAFSTTVSLSGGSNTITIVATDNAGNTTTITRTVTRATSGPTLTITSPTSGIYTNNSSITVSGSVSDSVSPVKSVTVNGTAATVSNGSYSEKITLSEGSNTITVKAENQVGLTTTKTVTVYLDTAPPVLKLISPAAGFLTDSQPEFIFSATDETGGSGVDMSTVSIVLDGVQQTQGISISGDRITFSPEDGLDDGPHAITVTVKDKAGNVRGLTVEYSMDTTPPALWLDEPGFHRVVDVDHVTIRGMAWDDGSGLQDIIITDQSGNVLLQTTQQHFALPVHLEVGENFWTITLRDKAGLSISEELYMIRLITDRTQEDVDELNNLYDKLSGEDIEDWTEEETDWFLHAIVKGAYNDTDLNRVGIAVRYIKGELEKRGYIANVSPVTNWVGHEYMDRTAGEIYLNNVRTIRDAQEIDLLSALPLPKSIRFLNYVGANQIEKALVETDAIFDLYRWWTSGEITSGET